MNNLSGLQHLKPYIGNKRLTFIFIIFFSLISSLLGLIPIQILGTLVDYLSNSPLNNLGTFLLKISDYSMTTLILIFGIVTLMDGLVSALYGYIVSDTNNKIINEIRKDAVSWILNRNKLDPALKLGDLTSRIINDVEAVTKAVAGPLNGLLTNIMSLIFGLMIFMVWDIKLALSAMSGIPIIYILSKWIAKKSHELSRDERIKIGDANDYLTDIIGNFSLVKAYMTEDYEQNNFHKINTSIYDNRRKLLKSFNIYWPCTHLINTIITTIVIFLVYKSIVSDTSTAGNILVAFTYIKKIYSPIVLISRFSTDLSRADASLSRVFDLKYELSPLNHENLSFVKAPSLRFENLKISNDNKEVLNTISFSVNPGEITAIVGESGIGKSTFINSLIGLSDISNGKIFADDLDVTNDTYVRKKLFRICFQNPHILRRKIFSNLHYGEKPLIHNERLNLLCKELNIAPFLESNFNNNLSGGEKKRLSIGRTLNSYSPVYVFDEPTAELDLENRSRIKTILQSLRVNSTVIIITHDEYLLSICDNVIEFK